MHLDVLRLNINKISKKILEKKVQEITQNILKKIMHKIQKKKYAKYRNNTQYMQKKY